MVLAQAEPFRQQSARSRIVGVRDQHRAQTHECYSEPPGGPL